MRMWDVIIFDLDGTITDPKEGITKSVAYALSHFSIHVEDTDTLTYFIGPPLRESFLSCGLSEAQSQEAITVYRKRYATVGWAENIPYPDIAACLHQLKASGKILMVATSKAEPFALRILEHFDLLQYFDVICGTPMDDPNQTKADVIRAALERKGITDISRSVMVGDRKHDIEGGHEVGLVTVGVLYGYGSREEHEQYNADYIVENISDLKNLLLS